MEQNTRKRCTEHVTPCKLKKQILSCDNSNVSIDKFYLTEEFTSQLSDAFSHSNCIEFGNGAKFMTEPFHCCVLPNFLNSSDYLNNLNHELKLLKMYKKKNDLFQFKQSEDFGSSSTPHIRILKKILYEDCLSWMTKLTGIPLTKTVDMACSIYEYSDVLLCHDDLLDSRRVAFIFYMVPDWQTEDGGSLDLFNCDNGKPSDIAASLFPVRNNFVFFEVSSSSFHQVSEILNNKVRLSVSGWYHGPPLENKKSLLVEEPKLLHSPLTFAGDITKWINPIYLQPNIQLQIRQTFKENSEIELPDFFQQDKYLEVANTLNRCKNWKTVGPANIRHYEELHAMPEIIQECLEVLQSDAMCLIVSNFSGLALHHMAVIDSSDSSDDDEPTGEFQSVTNAKVYDAKISSSVRRWTHGYYTLLTDCSKSKCCLDATLSFNCDEWKDIYGGYKSYIAKGEVDELLRVLPHSNRISLVYTDEETSSFVKYINCRSLESDQPFFQDIRLTYYEN